MAIFDLKTDIYDLSVESLSEIFCQLNNKTDIQFIKEKNHVKFLLDYLGKDGLHARFVVVEKNYINKDYLIDYSTYYSTCYDIYSKTGFRLHFFSTQCKLAEFKTQFYNLIVEGVKRNKSHQDFWDEYYLGYIFLKPIPNLFIGFSLLKNYNYNKTKNCFDQSRKFWGIKDYKTHVFGNEIIIPSLAFQEQDQNVAACATIAIWSMLQIAAEDYYVILKSPSEITTNGGIVANNGNRLLPNKGLSVLQMCQAITQNNLVTEVRERTDYKGDASFNLYLKKLIHAYSNLRIPSILLINVSPPDERAAKQDAKDKLNASKQPEANEVNKAVETASSDHLSDKYPIQESDNGYLDDEANFDGHAVAISGYKMRTLAYILRRNELLKKKSKLFNPESIIWRADMIEKIYVHDDQWGPFSKMTFHGRQKIKSSWQMILEKKMLSRTEGLLVSVYPKVRIPYDDIDSKVISLNDFFIDHLKNKINGNIVWDIQIFRSEDFKTFIQNSDVLDDKDGYDRDLQFKFLAQSFPKYIWVATLQINDENVLHFIYDATGLSGSNIILSIFGYFPAFTSLFKKILKRYKGIKDTSFTYIFDYNIKAYIDAIID